MYVIVNMILYYIEEYLIISLYVCVDIMSNADLVIPMEYVMTSSQDPIEKIKIKRSGKKKRETW